MRQFHCVVKIPILAGVEIWLRLGAISAKDLDTIPAYDHVAFRTVEDHSVPVAALFIRITSANLTDQLSSVLEFVTRHLRVGRLSLVLVPESAARRVNPHRQPLIQPPAGNIQIVNSVVSQLAVTKVPKP